MMRLNLVLLLAVLASALYLVSVQYESRRLFSELDRAHTEALRLNTEWERLQVEKPAITTYVAYTPQAAVLAELQTVRAATEVGKTTR